MCIILEKLSNPSVLTIVLGAQNPGGGAGGGELLWIFYTYVGSGYFFGFKILNFNIFLCFQKNEYFLVYGDFVDVFGVTTKLAYIQGHFYAF